MESEKSLSESDLTLTTPENQYVTQRNKGLKRHRESELAQFKDDISVMLSGMMATQMSEIKKNTQMLNEIKQTNRSIEDALSFLSSQYDDMRTKIDKLETDAAADRKYITTLENKIADIQRENRKTSLEIKNVPIVKNETKENLVAMASQLGNTIACPIGKAEIKDIFRIKSKREQSTTSTIVLETTSTLVKNDVLKCCKAFNLKKPETLSAKHLGLKTSPDTPVYVAEQLTPLAARLHFLARELKNQKLYKYCWTSYGKVYVRKTDTSQIILINSETQIEKLKRENYPGKAGCSGTGANNGGGVASDVLQSTQAAHSLDK